MSRRTKRPEPRMALAAFTRQGNVTLLLMTGRNCVTEPVYVNYEGMKAVLRLNPRIEFSITILRRIPDPEIRSSAD